MKLQKEKRIYELTDKVMIRAFKQAGFKEIKEVKKEGKAGN